MKIHNSDKNKTLRKRPTLKYGMLALAILAAAIIVIQVVPGGSEDTEAADVSINLSNNSGSGTGYSWDSGGNILTISGSGNTYTITQNDASILDRTFVISSSCNATVKIDGINVYGGIELESTASLKLLLAGTNEFRRSILVPSDTEIIIDSAAGTGSTSGSLTVAASTLSGAAGIGSGMSDNSTITINGGTITAIGDIGGNGSAGIGGGRDGDGTVTINGGRVTATGGEFGAGIGGCYAAGSGNGTVTVNGGTVTAYGGLNAAGIGGGSGGAGTITVNGGTVTAYGGLNAPGIGGGYNSVLNSATAVINGGTVTAYGSGSTAGIASGNNSPAALTLKSEATLSAYTGGSKAISVSSLATGSTGYLVSAVFNTGSLPTPSSLLVYADGNTGTTLMTLTPSTAYRSFAFAIPGSTTSKDYNVYLRSGDTVYSVLRQNNDSPVLTSTQSLSTPAIVKMGGEVSVFIAVTDITEVPTSAAAGTPLALTGTVIPSNATKNTITWTVKNAGTTEATISGNTFSAAKAGTAVVTATITDGKGTGTPFTKDFTITVSGEGGGGDSGGGSGPNTMLWLGIAVVIIIFLVIAVFILHKKGMIKGI